MPLNDEARAALTYLKSRFEAASRQHAEIEHSLVEISSAGALQETKYVLRHLFSANVYEIWTLSLEAYVLHLYRFNNRRDTFEALRVFRPLAEYAIEILDESQARELQLLPPGSLRPEGSGNATLGRQSEASDGALRWLTLLHQMGRDHRPGALLRSKSSQHVGSASLPDGALAWTLRPGIFKASLVAIERILSEGMEQALRPMSQAKPNPDLAATVQAIASGGSPLRTEAPRPVAATGEGHKKATTTPSLRGDQVVASPMPPNRREEETTGSAASGMAASGLAAPKRIRKVRRAKVPPRPKTLKELAAAIRRDHPRQRNVPRFLSLIADNDEVTFADIEDKVHQAKVEDEAIEKTITNARKAIVSAKLPIALVVSDRQVNKKAIP
jgi:hypothetical protein